MKVAAPVHSNGQWQLPVVVNLSGTSAITTQPTTLNSGLSCHSVVAAVEANAIYITVTVNAAVAGTKRRAQCPPAVIKAIEPGAYEVFYRGPDESPVRITTIEIASAANSSPPSPSFVHDNRTHE